MYLLEIFIAILYHKLYIKREEFIMREDFCEYKKVEEIAEKFIEAVKNGKSEIVKPYFHENAVIFGQLDKDTIQAGSIQSFYDGIDKAGACGTDYVGRIDILTLEKTIAIVRIIEDNWHGYKFSDFLTLAKLNGEWKIVAKAYDTLSYESWQ